MTGLPPELEESVRGLEASFAALFRQYRQLLAVQADLLSPGLSTGAFQVLVSVAQHGPITPSAVAELHVADRGQISRTVKELEGLELITREPDPEDRRSCLLRATDHARERMEAVRRGPTGGGIRRDIADWPVEDVCRLGALIDRLTASRAARTR